MTVAVETVPVAEGGVPVLGHVPRLLFDRLAFMQKQRRCGGLVKIYLGRKPVYIVNDPELIHHMFVTDSAHFSKGKLFEKSRAVVGDGLLTSEGALHLRQRRLMQPAFHRDRIRGYVLTMRQEVDSETARWHDGQELDMHTEMFRLVLAVSARCLFSSALGQEAVREVLGALPVVLKGIAWRTVSPVAFVERLPTSGNRRFEAARARIRRAVADVINAYRAAGVDHGDVLSMLLTAQDEGTGDGMTDEQIHDEITTLLITGTASSAATLSWFFHELGRHGEAERKVQDEIDGVLGGRPARAEDLRDLPCTARTLNEVLRLHHPVWIATRRTTGAVDLGDYHLPQGTDLIWSLYTLHRDAALFPEPDRFLPDRWLDDTRRPGSAGAFLPFGAGNRQCIGDAFARTMATVVVATVASRWRLEACDDRPVRALPQAAVRPADFRMRLRARGAAAVHADI